MNITDPAFGNTEHKMAKKKKKCFFSPEILSPPYIQLIRLRERFKKIWTKTSVQWKGEWKKVEGENILRFSSHRQFIIEIEFLMQHLVNPFCSVNVLIHYIEKL